ncbi:uncharacterized protein DEA37_0006214 [Paragonimus westermani]|uniref:Reverse transcriptase n=1 Tax=Paragonimus westermani TaxID=34504 RepID=A0A5J4NJG1_9TREM|nr:uncharacterized protein DEA37_0006214 [Paragonimus westermani]
MEKELLELIHDQQKALREQELRQTKLMESVLAKLESFGQIKKEAKSESELKETVGASIQEFRYDPDNGITFMTWYNRYEDIFLVDGSELSDAAQVRLLVQKLGTAEHTQYCNYVLPKHPRDFKLKDTVANLSIIFGERTSLFNIRYNCLKLNRLSEEDIVTYAGRVNKECERFQIQKLTSDQFKSLVFVAGLTSQADADIRTRLLGKLDTMIEPSVQELTAEYLRLVNLKKDSQMVQGRQEHQDDLFVDKVTRNSTQQHTRRPTGPPTACWNCGQWHYVRFCPFRSHQCQLCSRYGHKESHCFHNRNSILKPAGNRERRQSNVVFATTGPYFSQLRKYATVFINGFPVTLQIDTASDITIVSRKYWEAIGKPTYGHTKRVARNASGDQIQFLGEFHCEFSFRNSRCSGVCFVSPSDSLNLLGIDWIQKLNLWNVPFNSICDPPKQTSDTLSYDVASIVSHKRSEVVHVLQNTYSDLFTGNLGLCTKAKGVFYLKPGSTPVFRPKRPVPFSATTTINAELDRLEQAGVLQRVSYSTWAAPIVVVRKANGGVRLCGDFSTGLNNALETHQYPLPIPEDLFARLNGGTVFSKIDLSDAYLQVEVEDKCKELLTINTHRGLYQYNRLPFGVKCAPAIFQQIMDIMLSDIPYAMAYMDDIIIVSSSVDDHIQHLHTVFQRIRDYGFTLRIEKCEIMLSNIRYLGSIIDETGRRPDPDKIAAIATLPVPKDKTTLQSFLGLVNYYNNFVPNMHDLRAPLNKLLQINSEWVWSNACQSSFERIKQVLLSDLLLTHYNPNLPIIVAADASEYGIGAVILHQFPDGHHKAVSHVSRTLTSAERNYSQIEKEGLALVYAVKKFHKMLLGRRFSLCTDHKPLLSIFGAAKGIPVHTANRLQRWALTLMSYDFTIKYVRTGDFGHADALSRLISQKMSTRIPEDTVIASINVDADVRYVLSDSIRHLPVTFLQIKEAMKFDRALQRVLTYLRVGWPNNSVGADIMPFYRRRDALTILDGCVMLRDRVVIPAPLRSALLRQLHVGHPGMTRMKAISRSYMFWPGIDQDIESTVRSCESCALAAKAPPRVNAIPWPEPKGPWTRIHIDFAGPLNGNYYFVVVDAYSKWPEVIPMSLASTSTTVTALGQLFSQFGVPESIVSDNGPQFTSMAFVNFCKAMGTQLIHTPVYHPQSNGQVERFVDTFKRALQKLQGEGTVPDMLNTFLRTYRSTPNTSGPEGKSPAEAFLGRRIRTPLDLMLPSKPNANMCSRDGGKKHSHRSQNKRVFKPGDLIYIMNAKPHQRSWIPGRVMRRIGSVMYQVQTQSGTNVRHVNHIQHRYTEKTNQLPLDILLDTFELPTPELETPLFINLDPVETTQARNQCKVIQGDAHNPSWNLPCGSLNSIELIAGDGRLVQKVMFLTSNTILSATDW